MWGGRGWDGGGVGWDVFSPIMPSGTITPVTFRNLTFSPGGAERRGTSSDRLRSSSSNFSLLSWLPTLLLLPPPTTRAEACFDSHKMQSVSTSASSLESGKWNYSQLMQRALLTGCRHYELIILTLLDVDQVGDNPQEKEWDLSNV